MKKTFLYIFIISVLFFGCNSKKDENKIIELENLNSDIPIITIKHLLKIHLKQKSLLTFY